MDALLTSFIAAGLAEWGDKTQLLVIALAARFRQPRAILLGVAVAALANSLIAAAGGILVHGIITLRAISLLLAVALLFAGVAGLIRPRSGDLLPDSTKGAFATAAASFFALELGDKTQFVTFGIAAQFNSFALAALGATAGVLAASAPAAVAGERLKQAVPLKWIRIGISILFLLVAFIVAVQALRLV